MILEKTKIYGVDGVGGSSATLTRTDSAVGKTVTVGTSEITSDFSNCYPWCEMQEVTDSAGNVFIKIPKFYVKVTINSNKSEKWQICGCRYDGFSTLFVDGKGNEIEYVLVGKYEASGTSAKVFSKSGQNVLTGLNITQFRTACAANGSGYQQYDFLIDNILRYLWIVEFATTDFSSKMKGYCFENTAMLSTGNTDLLKTASGSPESNIDYKHACMYRGIENIVGNSYCFMDGLNGDYTDGVFICTDPTSYSSGSIAFPYRHMAMYTDLGTFGSDTEVHSLIHPDKLPIIGLPSTNVVYTGSDTDFGSGITGYGTGCVYVGAPYSLQDISISYGMLSYHDVGETTTSAFVSSRLCYKPIV